LKSESPFFFVSLTNSAQPLSARVAPRSSYHSSFFLFLESCFIISGCPPSPTSGIGRWSHHRGYIRAPSAMCKFELKSPLARRVLGLGGVGSGWRQKFTFMCSSPEVLTASSTNYFIHTSGSRSNALRLRAQHTPTHVTVTHLESRPCRSSPQKLAPADLVSCALTPCQQGCRH
jgi:hypothetical protein